MSGASDHLIIPNYVPKHISIASNRDAAYSVTLVYSSDIGLVEFPPAPSLCKLNPPVTFRNLAASSALLRAAMMDISMQLAAFSQALL